MKSCFPILRLKDLAGLIIAFKMGTVLESVNRTILSVFQDAFAFRRGELKTNAFLDLLLDLNLKVG